MSDNFDFDFSSNQTPSDSESKFTFDDYGGQTNREDSSASTFTSFEDFGAVSPNTDAPITDFGSFGGDVDNQIDFTNNIEEERKENSLTSFSTTNDDSSWASDFTTLQNNTLSDKIEQPTTPQDDSADSDLDKSFGKTKSSNFMNESSFGEETEPINTVTSTTNEFDNFGDFGHPAAMLQIELNEKEPKTSDQGGNSPFGSLGESKVEITKNLSGNHVAGDLFGGISENISKESIIEDTNGFGSFDSDNSNAFANFTADEDSAACFGSFGSNEDKNETKIENNIDDVFGDFGEAGEAAETNFSSFDASSIGDDTFGDFGSNVSTKDAFGDFGSSTGTTDGFGDFGSFEKMNNDDTASFDDFQGSQTTNNEWGFTSTPKSTSAIAKNVKIITSTSGEELAKKVAEVLSSVFPASNLSQNSENSQNVSLEELVKNPNSFWGPHRCETCDAARLEQSHCCLACGKVFKFHEKKMLWNDHKIAKKLFIKAMKLPEVETSHLNPLQPVAVGETTNQVSSPSFDPFAPDNNAMNIPISPIDITSTPITLQTSTNAVASPTLTDFDLNLFGEVQQPAKPKNETKSSLSDFDNFILGFDTATPQGTSTQFNSMAAINEKIAKSGKQPNKKEIIDIDSMQQSNQKLMDIINKIPDLTFMSSKTLVVPKSSYDFKNLSPIIRRSNAPM